MLEHVAELGTRRVQPGEDEHRQHVEHLGIGERAVVVGRVQEVRGEVARPGLGLATTVRQRGHPVLANAREGLGHALQPGRIAAEAAEEVLDPRHEEVGVGGIDADHAQERLGGKAQRELADEVAAARRGDLLDEPAAQAAHPGFGVVDRPGREPGVEDPPVLDVVRGIDLRGHEAVDRIGLPRRDRLAREDLGVLVHVTHGVVAREDPVALGEGVEVQGARFAELLRQLPVAPGGLASREVAVHDRTAAQLALHRFRGRGLRHLASKAEQLADLKWLQTNMTEAACPSGSGRSP